MLLLVGTHRGLRREPKTASTSPLPSPKSSQQRPWWIQGVTITPSFSLFPATDEDAWLSVLNGAELRDVEGKKANPTQSGRAKRRKQMEVVPSILPESEGLAWISSRHLNRNRSFGSCAGDRAATCCTAAFCRDKWRMRSSASVPLAQPGGGGEGTAPRGTFWI